MMNGDLFFRLIDDLKRDEGFCGKPYRCSTGHWTVGFGTTFPLTKQEGEMLLRHRVSAMEGEVTRRLLDEYGVEIYHLHDNVKVALMNLAYQVGVNGLFRFKRMLQAVKRSDWPGAEAEALDSLWAKQTPKRAKRVAALLGSPGGKRKDNRKQEVVI